MIKVMNTDATDLQEYIADGSEPAFRRIVERHMAMVHGVASRSTRDHFLAQEITQSVFGLLARKARVVPGGHLSGWLHRTATGECRNAFRKEARRNRLHQRYVETMNEHASPAEQWNRIAPHLDQAVGSLSATDRELVLLHYFEERSFPEIAAATGRSAEACKKRTQRALERLGGHLQRQGVTAAAGALAPALSYGALPPVNLSAALISSTAINTVATTTGGAGGLFQFLQMMTTKQIAAGGVVLIALAAIPTALVAYRRSDTKVQLSSAVAPRTVASSDHLEAAGKRKSSINWAEIARTKFVSRNYSVQAQEKLELSELVKGMSNEELDKAMDEVVALDIPRIQKRALYEILMMELTGRDPMLVLSRLPKDKTYPPLVISMSRAFRALLEKDAAGAETWLKQQVAEGNLSEAPTGPGEPMDRFLFEAYLLENQAKSDPIAAVQRVMSYPDSEKPWMLMSAADHKFPAAFDLAMDYYTRSGDDSLVNQLMDSDALSHGVHFEKETGLERMHQLAERMPDADARAAAHARLDEVAKVKPEGVPLELLEEGEK